MKKLNLLLAVVIALSLILTSCSAYTSSPGFCGLYMGNGTYDNDIDKIIYPGQEIPNTLEDYHKIMYFPCNERNYLVNSGKEKHLDGTPIGDLPTPLEAKTMSGTDVLVEVSVYWRLNQNFDAMAGFYAYQLKFKAASDKDVSGDENSSTPGWNKMLAETLLPALKRSTVEAMSLTSDAIWQTNDAQQRKIAEDYAISVIKDKLRPIYGSGDLDYFCGSASSGWKDPKKPGEGEYFCAPISIVIDIVKKNPDQTNASTQGSIEQSQQRLKVATELYGPEAAHCWLGYQDTIQLACSVSPSCNIIINGNPCTSEGFDPETPAIVLPSFPTVEPTAEAVPTAAPTTAP